MHARSDLTLPCYCSAAAKNRSACAELLFLALGFQPNGCIPDLSYCSAAASSRFACSGLLSGSGCPTDRAHVRFELELPCYCSSAPAKSRFSCTELLSGPGLPIERVHARFGFETTTPPFCCCDISLFLHGIARSTAGFANARLF